MSTSIRKRRDTAANWTSINPVLAAGEEGWESDTRRAKTGDGTTAWASLTYDDAAALVSTAQQTALNLKATVLAAPTGVAATDTATIQTAIDALNAADGGTITAQPGTYLVTGITIKTGVYITGAGVGATIIKLADATNTDLVTVPDFGTLTGGDTSGGEYNWGFSSLTLDGNAVNQTTACWAMRVYGYGYRMHAVEIYGAYSGGVFSEWGTSAGGNMEAVWQDFKILDNRGVGLDWQGPHDSSFDHGYVVSGPFGAYGDTGIWIRGNSGGEMWSNVHVWGYNDYGWVFEHSGQAVNCQSEGATVANLKIVSDKVRWEGVIYGTNDYHTGELGVKLGVDPGQKVQNVILDVRLHNFGTTSVPIDITGSNGRNIVRGTIMRGSASTIITGTSHIDDWYDLHCTDYPGQGLQNRPLPMVVKYTGAQAAQIQHKSQTFATFKTDTLSDQRLQLAYNGSIEFFTDLNTTRVGTLLNAGEWGTLTGHKTAGEETLQRPVVTGTVSTTSGRLTLTYFTARAALVAANVTVCTGGTAAAATPTICRIGLYLVNGDNTLTLVASTANDTTLFAATFTSYTKAFSASYTLAAGTRYAIGVIVVNAGAVPTFAGAGPSVSALALVTPRVGGYITGQTDLPSSVSASLTGGAAMVYANLTA